jgi:hypothetical protein
LRASAQRIMLFCEAGRTYVPKAGRLLFAHLEESVIECVAPHGGSFHPKVWLLRYTMEENVAFRFLCLSRNLTFDRCWDTALVLDGRPHGRSKAANRPLAEFLRALPVMATRALPVSRSEALERLASDVLRVEWELPEGFESVAFRPLGHHRASASGWPFDGQRIDRLLVLSPFVSSSMLERLTERSSDNVLISRPDQLDACDPTALDGYAEAYVLEDTASQDDADALEDSVMRGLHAKFYIADQGWHSTLWTGSANATASAFERNVEFLVELTGKKSVIGIQEMLRPAGEHGVSLLLAPYLRSEDASVEPPAERALEHDATELRHRLAAGGLQLQVVAYSRDGLYDMVLTAPSMVGPVASVSSLEAWPITRRPEIAVEQVDLASHELARFTALPLEKLTPFLAFRAVLCAGAVQITADFVLNLPLIDAPPSRQAQLLRSMLSSRAEVLRYLLYLLAGDSTEAVPALAGEALSNGRGQTGSGGSLALPLLEALLRTLDRDPAKLVAIRRVVEELASSETTADLLPDDWDAVWGAVDAAAGERGA